MKDKHTLKKGRAFRNTGKIYFPDREISLALFLDYLLIRSLITGSGPFILSRWSLEAQLITGF